MCFGENPARSAYARFLMFSARIALIGEDQQRLELLLPWVLLARENSDIVRADVHPRQFCASKAARTFHFAMISIPSP
jgi:hypothetical protein